MLDSGSSDDFSETFYRGHAVRYAEISQQGLQSTYRESEHPRLRSDQDLIERLKELVPPPAGGLDIGCGAEARDVAHLFSCGYDVRGLDAVPEVIDAAVTLHPGLASRLTVTDIRIPLDLPGASLDFIICNSVIQHIDHETVGRVVLPSFTHVLRPGGVLLLVFKTGRGVLNFDDPHFQTDRSFILYDEPEVEDWLSSAGLDLIPPDGSRPGGITLIRDGKGIWHAVGFWRKPMLGADDSEKLR